MSWLLEVRAWKERCYQENRHLTDAEYLKKLKEVKARLKAEYHLNSPTVTPSTVK